MSGLRPRLGLPLPGDAEHDGRLLEVVNRELRQGPQDLVVIADPERAQGGELPGERVGDGAGLGDALTRARAAGRGSVLFSEPGDALARGRELVAAGRLDALLVAGPERARDPLLRLRRGARALELSPERSLRESLEADPEVLAAAALAGRQRLRQLGLAQPRLILLGLAGEQLPEAVARQARARGLELDGPWLAERAVRERADLWLTPLTDQAELLLALLGSGPETVLSLAEPLQPEAWVAPLSQGRAGIVAALSRLDELARGRGPLVAQQELERKPTVSISKRQAPAATTGSSGRQAAGLPADRCPYCHRSLFSSPDGDGDRAGPPVVCASCETPHHRDCLGEHGRCTVVGCKSTMAKRLGLELPIERLGEETPRWTRFESLTGDAGSGPPRLRVEAPFDDPQSRTIRQASLALELAEAESVRGGRLEGYVVIKTPRPLPVRGGLLRVRSTLTTQVLEEGRPAKLQAIVHRQAPFLGEAPGTALSRFSDGVSAFFGAASERLTIPAGVRRYPISLDLPLDFPSTFSHTRNGVRESVETVLELELDTLRWSRALTVR